MRILIYEYITGGGLLRGDDSSLESLRPEGEAMVKALAAEFAAIPQVEVHLLRDGRLLPAPLSVSVHRVCRAEDELPTLATLAAAADWTILIAPEVDGILLHRARLVEDVGGRLLSPSSRIIELCSDKRRTTAHLRGAGIPAPRSLEINVDADGLAMLPHTFSYPAILKRIDGAGSLGMRRIEHPGTPIQLGPGRWIVERLVPGCPVSVAVLCGPQGHVVLPPFTQRLDEETFSYSGGSRLMDAVRPERGPPRWAAKVADTLDGPIGYLGIDMVLGDAASGKQDAVIEINPRLTSSLVGLRAIARTNLAKAMLAVAKGQRLAPEFTDERVSFSADGSVGMEV